MRKSFRLGLLASVLLGAGFAVRRFGVSPHELLALVRDWAARAGPAGPVVHLPS